MVTGADLLAALRVASLRRATVAGIEIHIRGVTGAERKLLIDRAREGSPLQAWELVQMCACNDRGDALFGPDQATALASVDGEAIEQLARQVLEASNLLPEQQELAAKN